MKLMRLRSPLWSLFVVALLVGLPFLCSEAQAQRGGAAGRWRWRRPAGGGGFSGGSFRGGGWPRPGRRWWSWPPRRRWRGRGGVAAEAPGGAAAEGQGGGAAHCCGWHGPGYRGPGYGGVAAGIAVGAVVATLPATAAALSVAGQRYYYDGSTYYQPCYQGTDVNYCVVADPNQ